MRDDMAQETPEKEKKGKKELLLKWSKRVFLILVAIFLIRYFYRNMDDIRKLNLKPKWGLFFLSLVFYSMYKLSQASFWHYITVLNEAAIPFPDAIKAYLYSILGKYIPGKVFMLLARIPPYQERGVPARKVTICFLLENVCTILGAGLLFLLSLFVFPSDAFLPYKWVTIVLIIVFFICLNPAIINFFLGLLQKVTKKEDLKIPITYRQMIRVVLLFVCNWVIYGTGFYFLVSSFYPIGITHWLFASGMYALSCIAGILAVFSPSGLGVREGILLLGLSMIMDRNMAMVLSIVARLWAVITELVLIGVIFVIGQTKKGLAKHSGKP